MVAVPVQDDVRRILDDDGRVLPGARVPDADDDTLVRIFDAMMLVRIMDDRMLRLQRQGRLGFYMPALGEEATHFAVAALRPSDWVFPSYRDQGAWFWRGYTVDQYVNQLFGNAKDPTKGRQMPVHHSASWLNLVSISGPVGTQIPQAVGAAYAAKTLGKDDVALAFFGEGTSSTGEFHVGLNFAGVWKAPVVFVCRNNGWATSTPTDKQTRARTFAQKGVGYGVPAVRVDGNDVLAMLAVTTEATQRARSGDGPTLVEALTYRAPGPESPEDPAAPFTGPGDKKDPIARYRGFLRARGLWSDQLERATAERHNQAITDALASADTQPAPPVDTMFDDVYEELPRGLAEQRDYLRNLPRAKNPHHHG
jgi:pyruvate dehydrogenase E1 component alpha subunit